MSFAVRRFWDIVYARRMLRHRQRPNIEPWPGSTGTEVTRELRRCDCRGAW